MVSQELQRCLNRVNQEIDCDEYEYREDGGDEHILEEESQRFKKKIGQELSGEYIALMAETNGVLFNGMTIFPLLKHAHCDETID
jgi:hypothetical protein